MGPNCLRRPLQTVVSGNVPAYTEEGPIVFPLFQALRKPQSRRPDNPAERFLTRRKLDIAELEKSTTLIHVKKTTQKVDFLSLSSCEIHQKAGRMVGLLGNRTIFIAPFCE